MNKLLSKIVGAALGLTMAIGVGVALGSNREVARVDAAADTYISLGTGTAGTNTITWTVDNGALTITLNKAASNNFYTTSTGFSGVRYYIGNVFSIVAGSNYKVTGVKITLSSSGSYDGGYLHANTSWASSKSDVTTDDTTNLTLTNCSDPAVSTVMQVESKSSSGVSGIYLGTTVQRRPTKFEVKYTTKVTTHTVTISVNNASYGSVNKTSVTGVADNATISANGAVLTVGNTTVTATPAAQSDQHTYAFSNWSGIPTGGKVTGNITVTANFTATTRTYNVENNVSNASFTGASTVTYGTAYSGRFTANSGYILPASLTSVTIKGTATNNYSYNSTTGEFSIAAQYVTGAIVITGACEEAGEDPVGISYSLLNCTIPGKPTQMYPSQQIELTIVPDDHYKLPTEEQNKVSVTGASNWVYDDETGSIMIDGANGAVSVSAECVKKAQNSISMGTLTGVSADGDNPTEVEEGAIVILTFTANSGYGLPGDSGVIVSGAADSSWTQGTGKLQITGGTSNITVSINGIQRDLTDGSLTLGTKKTSYTTGDDFELPSTVTANFNVAPLTVNVKNDVVVSGPYQNGVVTGSGTITLTYTYEPTGSTQSASYAITATPISPSTGGIAKITNISDLTVGSTVYLVCEGRSKQLSGISTTSTKYGLGTDYTTTPANTYPLTVSAGNGGTGYAFKNSSNNYLYWTSGNSLNVHSDLSDNTSWTVSFDASGNATILNVANSERQIMWNYSSPRFACYTGQTPTYDAEQGYNMVQLYKNYPAVDPELKWITAEVKSGTYYKGNSVTASDFVVTGHYNDESSSTISSSITVTNGYLANVGTNTVTLTYNNSLSCTATVTAVQAPVTGVELDVTSASIGLDESYYLSDISVTVNPPIAIQDYTWSLEDDGDLVVGVDYTFDGDEYHSINPGTVVFRCTADADTSKYADFTLSITGVPTVSITETEFSGYVGKGDVIHFVYGNISDSDLGKINFVSSAPSVVDFADGPDAESGSGTIEIEYKSQGNSIISVSYNGGAVLDTVSVSVSNDSVVSVTWSATDIDVWSGATLNTAGWNVQYEMASGDTGAANPYVIKLVGQSSTETITAGYEFKGSDNGKTIHVEYGNVPSTSINVTVTQRINNVLAKTYIENDWENELTSKTWSEAGSQTLNGKSWTMSGEDDGTGYMGWDSTKGQQFGSGSHPYDSVTLASDAFEGTISKVEVTTSGAKDVVATVSVSVGNTEFKCSGSASASISATSTKYTFTGKGSGTITISWANSSSKAIYFKVLGVTSLTEGESVQIANSESHKEAQRVAVKFANAFNTAMLETERCTTGLNAAWSECASAYSTFLSDCAALELAHEGEGEYAKNLVRYATAQYSDDSGEACIERAMKTYEICVSKHHLDPFMYDDDGTTPLRSVNVSGGLKLFNIQNSSTILIVSIVSLFSVAAIGGYFFLRTRKED